MHIAGTWAPCLQLSPHLADWSSNAQEYQHLVGVRENEKQHGPKRQKLGQKVMKLGPHKLEVKKTKRKGLKKFVN